MYCAQSGAVGPFFTTSGERACSWQEGGALIPGTTDTFGGSSTTEYGPLLQLTYPGPGFQPIRRFNDFRQVLDHNPCLSAGAIERAG